MSRELESAFDLEWSPRLVIEASAGTGKTYTIVGLFVRLLLEKKLTVDQILVMTFTKKATAELRGRIYERLRECLSVLRGEESTDPFLMEFHNWFKENDLDIQHLEQAVQDFDENQVYTIHGFCQKVLNEMALQAGTPFEMEISKQDEILQHAYEDFWRSFMNRHSGTEAGRYYISKLLDIADTPDDLRDELKTLFQKPYAELEGETLEDPINYLGNLLSIRKRIVDMWREDEKEILDILYNCDVSRYQTHLDSRLDKFRTWMNDDSYSIDEPHDIEKYTSTYLYDEDNLKKNGSPTPKHPIFDLFTEYSVAVSEIGQIETTLIHKAFVDVQLRRDQLLNESNTISYNDLLTSVEEALTAGNQQSREFAKTLLNKYPYALVDEFQDTDPIQYSIFDSIYPETGSESGLIMVGDPKQAIYGFRGADVYTYFKARSVPGNRVYKLDQNFRSSDRLIKGVNRLFSEGETPFLEESIHFYESRTGKPEKENRYIEEGKIPVPLTFVTREGVTSKKPDSKEFVINQTVKEIADLLERAEQGDATLDGRKLETGDIAVLVNSHRDAEDIKQKLKEVGIGAVTYSNKKVFETFEAQRLKLLMEAVLDPYHTGKLNGALLTGFWGTDLKELHDLKEDSSSRDQIVEELQEYGEQWEKFGFYSMFRKLLLTNDGVDELAGMANAERIFTNLYQLAEICSGAELEFGFEPRRLLHWFEKQMADPDQDDEKTLLLESDQNLVTISTIHNSKGLQFPVVFCPTLWEGRTNKKETLYEYHPEGENELVINIDQEDNEQRTDAQRRGRFEAVAEEVRKMYVALTRAEYKCYVMWDHHTDSNYSGLGSLLLGKELMMEALDDKNIKFKEGGELTGETVLEKLRELQKQSPESIDLKTVEDGSPRENPVQLSGMEGDSLSPRVYNGREQLPVYHAQHSFSSLMHRSKSSDERDYDQYSIESYLEKIAPKPKRSGSRTIFDFPKGADAGTAIHHLFEHEKVDFSTVLENSHREWIEEFLEGYPYEKEWAPVLETMLKDVTGSEIGDLQLSAAVPDDELREMEFTFAASEPSGEELIQVIRGDDHDRKVYQPAAQFLTGFIDLIVRQNDTYYILDYKSNYLGDSTDDYSQDRLKEEIEGAGYDLQYHLYTVALVKYLRNTIPDFDYEKNFGGAAYLFVRGMEKGSSRGVWFDKPNFEVIRKLESVLGGSDE